LANKPRIDDWSCPLGFAQHNQVKEEIVKQDFIPFILGCTTKVAPESLTPLLETIWSLAFLPDAAMIIRANQGFLEQVETISQGTNDDGLKKAADGLKWKLIDGRTVMNYDGTKEEACRFRTQNGRKGEQTEFRRVND
jgi:hypothetical protein